MDKGKPPPRSSTPPWNLPEARESLSSWEWKAPACWGPPDPAGDNGDYPPVWDSVPASGFSLGLIHVVDEFSVGAFADCDGGDGDR